MKKTFFALIIIAILSSCTKKDDIDVASEILGTWTWVKSTGGVSGNTETPESTGKEITLEVTEDTYKRYVDGDLEIELSYFLVNGRSIWTPVITDLLVFEDDSKQSVEMSTDKLSLYEECYDCYVHEYIRQ